MEKYKGWEINRGDYGNYYEATNTKDCDSYMISGKTVEIIKEHIDDLESPLKIKILKHLKATNGKGVTIHRNYKANTVVLDYFGGACVKYNYNGKWLCG